MAIETIDQPNPPALPSNLPAETLLLAKVVEKRPLDKPIAEGLKQFRRAADYIAAGKRTLINFMIADDADFAAFQL